MRSFPKNSTMWVGRIVVVGWAKSPVGVEILDLDPIDEVIIAKAWTAAGIVEVYGSITTGMAEERTQKHCIWVDAAVV